MTTARGAGVALAAVLMVHLLITIDIGALFVAVPAIRNGLEGGSSQMQMIVASYSLAFAVALVCGGRLGDLYGRRRTLLLGVAGFTVSSALASVAPSASWMIVARLLTGLSVALAAPQVLAVIQVTYSGHPRSRALGLFGTTQAIGMFVGQIGAGLLIRADVLGIGWRIVFVCEAGLGAAVLVLSAVFVPESRAARRASLDLVGSLILAIALALIVYPLIMGRSNGWDTWVWVCLAVSVPALGGFVGYESRVRARGGAPLIDLALVRIRSFAAAMVTGFVYLMTHAPSVFLFNLAAQDGLGYDALGSALWYSTVMISFFVGTRYAAKLVRALGRRAVLLGVGCVAVASSVLGATALLSGGDLRFTVLTPGLVLLGLGGGLAVPMFFMFAMAEVPDDDAGAAAGAFSTAQQVAVSVGIALVGLVYFQALPPERDTAAHAHAFGVTSLAYLLVLQLFVFALVRFLPPMPHTATRQGPEVPAALAVPYR